MAQVKGVHLSIVLPCRNQGDYIGGVLEGWFAALGASGLSCELVAVPNGCTDDTPSVVRGLMPRHPGLVVVDNPRGGWGLSVRMGLAACRGEVVGYTNSARTEPATLVKLHELYTRNAPCLAKVRRDNRGAPLREAGSLLYNIEARLLFGVRAPDVNGTPKLFPRALLDNLRLGEDGDLLDLELMALVSRMGMPVVDLVVEGFARHGGKSTTTMKSAVRMYWGALGLHRRMARPRGVPGEGEA